ncbi:MAG: hypothetical protein BMS9Abin29_2329 [Gemmatimonadota bacterium]|nr:MAG: hypothetical protein BMS9Abin29_2329 [Gemmatimonadota bacterium]
MSMKRYAAVRMTLALALALPGLARAQVTPTKLLVRVVANDAKIIGSGVGGARIVIREVSTGKVLASGLQEGSTGNTRFIMVDPIERGGRVFDTPGAAGYTATLQLSDPTQVEIVVEGPLGTEQALQRASKTVLMVPGQHLEGEGVIVVLNGFTVEIQSPAESTVPHGELEVQARVTMLCGCPTEPGGLWDADDIEITARLVEDGRVLAEVPLVYAGQRSIYRGTITSPGSGEAELQVIAVDVGRANTGMATRSLRIH